jgi:glycosyltransferase involved in cell wall biosynthesis
MKRVLQVVLSLESSGSAGIRLHMALLEAGIQSRLISLRYSYVESNEITYLGFKSRMVSRIDTYIQSFLFRNKLKQYGSFSYPIFGTNIVRMDEVSKSDVIYLHWILGGFLNISSLEALAKIGKPIIFILHDMWSITGGCHHSFSCEKYKTMCSNCQMFPVNRNNDLSSRLFKKKAKLFSKYKNLYFVSPSKWLYDCARSSALLKEKQIFYIPNIIDGELFKPVDKKTARKILNLESKQTIIAFGAISVNNPIKGWDYLKKSLELLLEDKNFTDILILVFGGGNKNQIENNLPFKVRHLGYLRDEYSMILAFSSADVFVIPSLADNQPTTVMESLACGTPVVGFKVGGIPDMIIHKENGYLAEYKDIKDLCNGISFCLENKLEGKILPDFKKEVILKQHLELIQKI